MCLKKRTLIIALTVMTLVIFGLLPLLQAAEFSADMEISAKGKMVARGKIFIQENLSRTEMAQGGRKITVISRPDKGLMWSLIPQGKTYMEMPMEADSENNYSDSLMKELKKSGRLIGKETVNKIACDKYEFTDDGRKATYWISEKDNIPVRIVTGDSEINYYNIQVGRQSANLFSPPADYKKFNMPQMPGGMQGGNPGGMNMPAGSPR